ncbi:MAG: tRNA sulfurtransferase, partial [Candidatus Aenigmatarchaeota archaeon]
LGLKSKPVRRRFSDRLITNIHKGLDSENIEHGVEKTRGRIFIETEKIDGAVEILRKIFGIVSISPVKEIESDLNTICDEITEISQEYFEDGDTFSIRARRSGSHNFTSQMIERKAGSMVLGANEDLEVDLDNPDKTIYVEARQRGSYIFLEKVEGPGGMPLGTQEKVLVLVSDTLYSPVACWLMMKRGCSVLPIFVDNRPYENLEDEREHVSSVLGGWNIGETFSMKRYENGDTIFKIKENVEKDLGYLLNKRILYRVMENIAEKENCKAIVSPDTTEDKELFKNMKFVDETVKIPILRPLIGFDRKEIEEFARKIGNYDYYVSRKKNKIFTKKRFSVERNDIKKVEEDLDFEDLIEENSKKFG